MTTPEDARGVPEALRLAQFFESMQKSSHRWWDGVPVHEKAAATMRALHAEVEALRGGWRPIETAPETGDFLVYCPNEPRNKVHGAHYWKGPNAHLKIIGHYFHFDADKPTHWRPNPPPTSTGGLRWNSYGLLPASQMETGQRAESRMTPITVSAKFGK